MSPEIAISPAHAKRERTKLRRKRVPTTIACWKCGGSGYIAVYAGIYNGMCFLCKGSGRKPSRMYEDAADQQLDDELTEIIESERIGKIKAAADIRAAEHYDRDWDAAHREFEAHLAVLAIKAQQQYLGEVDERITVEGTVKVTMVLDDGMYGDKILMVIEDADGNFVKTIGSGETLWKPARGAAVTMVGTVKAHEMYKGDKQTVLFRCKITKWEDNE